METTTKKSTEPAAPAKALSPAELAEELMHMAEDAMDWKMEEEERKAQAALDAVRAKVARAGEKQLRILRAKSVEEARAILAENPADVNLKKLCQRISGWKPLQEKGATDEEVRALLGKQQGGWPHSRPYPRTMPSAEHGYGDPRVWVDPDKGTGGGPHLSGQKLVDAVRRVMSIPKPAAPPKPPAAKKAAAAPAKKKGSTKAPAKAPAAAPPDGGGDDDEGGGAPSVLDGLQDRPQTPMEHPSDAAVPGVEAGGTYTPAQLGLRPQTFEELHRGFKVWPPSPDAPAPHPPRIGPVVKIGGGCYAVLDAAVAHEAVTYRLVPVHEGPVAFTSWEQVRAKHPDCATEDVDLAGLRVRDPLDFSWTMGSNQTADAFVRVPRAAVRLAHEERPAAAKAKAG